MRCVSNYICSLPHRPQRYYTTNIAKSTSAYMLTLVKETTTLHRVLSKILPANEIKVPWHTFSSLLGRVVSSF
jgi:hypothetical protein